MEQRIVPIHSRPVATLAFYSFGEANNVMRENYLTAMTYKEQSNTKKSIQSTDEY